MLRTFGHGEPDEETLLTSADNELTLIVQGTMQPFIKEEGAVKTRHIKIHALPWPTAVLQELPLDTEVSLRVTLSYFVEPSPGERGWDKKYGYASHGMRFAVQRPTETAAQFMARINAYGRDENYDADAHQGDAGRWFLAPTRQARAAYIPTCGPARRRSWPTAPTSPSIPRWAGGRRGPRRNGTTAK